VSSVSAARTQRGDAESFRSIAVPVRRYDGAIVAAINDGSHVNRTSTGEMIDRFPPPLKSAAAAAQPLLL
jgi:IclR family pca regulon transcriptional regulator